MGLSSSSRTNSFEQEGIMAQSSHRAIRAAVSAALVLALMLMAGAAAAQG
jgi:hypothetical protein